MVSLCGIRKIFFRKIVAKARQVITTLTIAMLIVDVRYFLRVIEVDMSLSGGLRSICYPSMIFIRVFGLEFFDSGFDTILQGKILCCNMFFHYLKSIINNININQAMFSVSLLCYKLQN